MYLLVCAKKFNIIFYFKGQFKMILMDAYMLKKFRVMLYIIDKLRMK